MRKTTITLLALLFATLAHANNDVILTVKNPTAEPREQEMVETDAQAIASRLGTEAFIITDADGNVTEAFVGSGFLEFINNQANLVCISVELPEEIDKRRAEEAAERAAEELRQQKSINEYYVTQANLSRAMERLKIKNKHQI